VLLLHLITAFLRIISHTVGQRDALLLFGGIVSRKDAIRNILRGGENCPNDYKELKFSEEVIICLIETTQDHVDEPKLKFRGFFSCSSGIS
jgi:hypothetical protein